MTDGSREQADLNCLEEKLRQADDGEAAADIWKQMDAPIRRLAQSVAFQRGIQDAEFVDEAPSIIFVRYEKFSPKKGRFTGWCRTVLKRWGIDRFRKQERSPHTTGHDLEKYAADNPAAGDDTGSSSACSDRIFDELFGDEDVEKIKKWNLKHRIVLLVLSGLWVNISTEQWPKWCEEFGIDQGFPPENVRVESDPPKRIRPLADCLGEHPNTVSQLWLRHKDKLASLKALREHRNNG